MTDEKVTVQFFYDVEHDLVMIQSPMTGARHGFIRQSMPDFVEWLGSDRWKYEKWFHLHMMYHYYREVRTLVSCDGRGVHSDFMVFSGDDSEFREQAAEFCRAIEYFDRDVIKPYINLRSQGRSDQDVALLMKNLQAFEGEPIWQAGDG